jgi:hypothetical protein
MRRGIEERVLDIAARQHGVVTRTQLLAAGLTPRAIQGRLESGRLRALHHGVYHAGPLALAPPWARELSAVLACGPSARASHRTAASLWDIAPRPDAALPVEVKVPGHKVIRRPGIRAYRVRGLEAHAFATVHGVPATDPVQTLLDGPAFTRSDFEDRFRDASAGTISFVRPIPPWPGSPRPSPCDATGFAASTQAEGGP